MDELFERIFGKLRKTGFLTDDLTVQKDGNQQVILITFICVVTNLYLY